MANFDVSFEKTMQFEGGYSNHTSDKGGETYRGISRVNWPQWVGWTIIDRYKSSPISSASIEAVLSGSDEIYCLVKSFYRVNFWNLIGGDDILSQQSADNIFDFAVNSGVSRAVKYAQRIVGAVQDGVMGPITLKYINKKDGFVTLYKAERLAFFNRIVQNDESQKVFLKGWTNRVQNA